ncbi:hypothetical protein EYF80_016080 [Liparis tanakae]|uniref:Uncharacterized protein n=1 Tax=Liparis tanakae TaxID=230148 RepID=A0A4Z2I787_9TELE|nr:hypothetical protein EYF80_016080 [Liparis tanakae]
MGCNLCTLQKREEHYKLLYDIAQRRNAIGHHLLIIPVKQQWMLIVLLRQGWKVRANMWCEPVLRTQMPCHMSSLSDSMKGARRSPRSSRLPPPPMVSGEWLAAYDQLPSGGVDPVEGHSTAPGLHEEGAPMRANQLKDRTPACYF